MATNGIVVDTYICPHGKHIVCPVSYKRGMEIMKLVHFAEVCDLPFGVPSISQFYDTGLVRTFADFFRLRWDHDRRGFYNTKWRVHD